jgi:hypothetical protein
VFNLQLLKKLIRGLWQHQVSGRDYSFD